MRKQDFNGDAKAITGGAAETIVWTGSEIPGEGIIAYHFAMFGGTTVADITRLRISANGFPIVNVSQAQLRAYFEAMSQNKQSLGTGDQSFSFYFAMMDQPTPDMQDVCQFPTSSNVQIELLLAVSASAGSIVCGYTETTVQAEWHPRLLGSQMNIPASVQNGRYSFAENGIVRGVILPMTGIDRARVVLGGETAFHMAGPVYNGGTAAGNLVLEAQRALYATGETLLTPLMLRTALNMPAPSNSSYVELTTQATWSGVSEEVCVYAIAPNGPQPAQG